MHGKNISQSPETQLNSDAETNKPEIWVLTILVDGSDPNWDVRNSIVASPERMARLVDLENLPAGATLIKGKLAWEFFERGLRDEAQWQDEQQVKRQAGGNN
jgi:hypothetical protein